MRLKNDELVIMNALLDGKKIRGFYEKELADNSMEYLKNVAGRLMEKGKNELDVILKVLNCYKKADSYLIINGNWTAMLTDCDITLLKKEEEYEFVIWDKGEYVETIYRENNFFHRHGIEQEKIKTEGIHLEELSEQMEENMTDYAIIMNYQKGNMQSYYVIYEQEGIRYCMDVFRGLQQQAGNEKIYRILKECEGR
ncbi:MAG: hypothetical protein PUF12_11765 [Thermoflexaceae bacterium]|nr:hypothetical protein [Thermoflexaceae bacterium]